MCLNGMKMDGTVVKSSEVYVERSCEPVKKCSETSHWNVQHTSPTRHRVYSTCDDAQTAIQHFAPFPRRSFGKQNSWNSSA